MPCLDSRLHIFQLLSGGKFEKEILLWKKDGKLQPK